MADVKRFVIIDENGQIVEQTTNMTIEVDAGTTARSVVNKSQLDQVASDAAAAVSAEQTRATVAETALGDSISSLQGLLADLSSSTAGDLTLVNNRITQEIADRIADVDSEEARALAAEAALQTAINTEISDRQAAVTAEAAARDAADVALGLRIDAEEAARATLDTTLRGLITDEATARAAADTTLQNNIDAEATARAAADTVLQGNIDAEASARAAADTTLQANIDAEASTRLAADNALTAALNAEIASRQAADAALQGEIDAEEALRATEITRVEGLISAEAAARAAADSAEATARADADATLTTNLAAEVTRATGEEARIEAKYDAGIAAEIAARTSGDADNAAAIAAEVARAGAAEATLSTNLAAEVARATDRENSIETALNNEISRATAEEIAVENRAKAYADARVQGLKNKDSVDFAFTRFVPNFDRDIETSFVPKFRAGQDWTPAGATEPAIEMFDELGVDSIGGEPYVIFDETGSYGWVALVAPLNGGAPGFRYVGGGEYIKDGVVIDPSPLSAFYDYVANSNPTTEARWNNCLNNGVFVMAARVEVIDVLADDNLEQLFARMPDVDTTVSGARVAIVQNNIGASTDWWSGTFKEVVDSGIYTWSPHYLVDDAIEALPKAQRSDAMMEYLNPADDVDHPFLGHGIYRRALTGGVASWSRAPDFAVGQEVSGSYVLVEQGLRGGPAEASGINPYVNYYMAWSWLDQRKLTQPNTGIVFNATGGGTSAVVGTNLLVATVFNRVGAYNFTHGLVRHPADPTQIMVQVDREAGIRVSSGGVSLELQDNSNLEFKAFSESEPNFKGLSVKGPLVGGMGASIERSEEYDGHRWYSQADKKALHSHQASYLMVDFWPLGREEDLTVNGSIAAGTLVAAANVSFGPAGAPYGTRNSIAVATWDAPGYIGVADWREDITAWPNFAELSSTYEYDTGVKGRVALSGSGALKVSNKTNFMTWDLSGFAVGEMVYVGAGTNLYGSPMSTIAHYSEVPSGKWAIPVGIKLNDSEVKLVDRPAFLKA